MKALAAYIMRGRLSAGSMATVFAVLAMILPPLSNVSGAVIGLVSLRRGAAEGLVTVGIATLAVGVLSFVTLGSPIIALALAVAVWLPMWGLSVILRRTSSWSLAVSSAGIIVSAFVILVHIFTGDPIAWWETVIKDLTEQAGLDSPLQIAGTAQMMTSVMAMAFLLSLTVSLVLARWWQATLYNPGGFGEEFRLLRLDRTSAIATTVLMAWALVVGGLGSFAADLALLGLAMFGVAGIALVHYRVDKLEMSGMWLLPVYLMLIFVPHVLLLLGLIGLADSWFDLRRFIKAKNS